MNATPRSQQPVLITSYLVFTGNSSMTSAIRSSVNFRSRISNMIIRKWTTFDVGSIDVAAWRTWMWSRRTGLNSWVSIDIMVYEVLCRNIPVSNVAIVFQNYERELKGKQKSYFRTYYSDSLIKRTNRWLIYVVNAKRWVKMSPNDECNPNESTKRLALLTASQCAW